LFIPQLKTLNFYIFYLKHLFRLTMEQCRSQSPYSFTRFKTFKNMEQLEGAVELIIGKEKK